MGKISRTLLYLGYGLLGGIVLMKLMRHFELKKEREMAMEQ